MKIIFSPACLEYGYNHIESPERVKSVYEVLKSRGYTFVEPKPTSEEDILKVHSKKYVSLLKDSLVSDADTHAYEKIYEYARLAAGGAVLAAKEKSFSIMRPPGHHAGRNGRALDAPTLGFCYLNNIAIAVKKMNKPTLILDIDGHHCNGTQEIFLGNEKVTLVSLHRHPTYPLTGEFSEANCFNFPLPADCGEKVYLKTLETAIKKVDMEKIEIIGVSAGFDTHEGDIASLGLKEESYFKIGKMIAELNRPTFFVLEGGYDCNSLGKDIYQLLKGFES